MELGHGGGALLLLDTCGERASVAVMRGGLVVADRVLEERTASGALLGVIREALGQEEVEIGGLRGVGVVNGPGSFTGVRVGLAIAKGLCEAGGVPLAAVSRLAVLAEAGGVRDGFAVLAAGRDQVYVRESGAGQSDREWMMGAAGLRELAGEREVVCAEERVVGLLGGVRGLRRVELLAGSAWGAVERCLAEGGDDVAMVDANYVRNEDSIYARRR